MRRLVPVVVLLLVAAACSGDSNEGADDDVPALPDPTSTTVAADETSEADTDTTEPPDNGQPTFAGTVPAPDFPTGLDWINTSDPLSLEQLRGKIVLLDFWTYGCINCIHVIPDLQRLEEEFAEELVVIGVHSAKFTNESATENIRQVVLRYGVEHPVVNDGDFVVWQTWQVNAWPSTVVIDPAGNVVGGHSGEGVYDTVAPVLRGLIAEFNEDLDRTVLEHDLEKDRQPSRVLSYPGKVEVSPDGERLFIADSGHHRIVMADMTGEVLAVYGNGVQGYTDGPALSAQFDAPQGMTVSADGTTLYVADTNNHTIRSIDVETGIVATLAGTGRIGWPPSPGFVEDVALNSPWDVLLDGDLMYVAMAGHHQLWVIDLENGVAQPLVGNAREGVTNGPNTQAELAQPSGLALDENGDLYFADSESSSIRAAQIFDLAGETRLVAGGATDLFTFGTEDGVGPDARFQHPLGVAIDPADGSLVIADTYNNRLRRIDPATQEVTTYLGGDAGWRDGNDPMFYEPGGLVIRGETLYVADTNNHAIRIIDLPTGETTTLVLSGIEAFEPPPGAADYRGTVVAVDKIEVATGTGTLILDLVLPDGYKINEDASSSVSFGSPSVVDADPVDITGAKPPITIPVSFLADGDLLVDLNLVYCRNDAESLCLFEQVRFVAPLTVAGTGSTASIQHAIEVPEL